MRRALQLLRRTAPVATATTYAACDDDKFTVEKVNVIKIPHLRDQGFPGANKSNVAAFGYAKFVSDEDCVLGAVNAVHKVLTILVVVSVGRSRAR